MSLPPRLVALTPGDLGPGDVAGLLPRLGRALEAGLPGLLLREPALGDRAWLTLATETRALAERSGREVWIAGHDRPHLAQAAGLPAVHLGFRSLAPVRVRARFALTLGLSTHAHDDESAWTEADYLFHGPVRETPPKPSEAARLAPVGFDGLARAVDRAARPVLALGGVRPEDVGPALDAGAHGVAVLSGVLSSPDPGAATRAYLEALAR